MFYVWYFKILWQFGGVGYPHLPYVYWPFPLCRHVDKLASGKSDGSSSARKQKFNPLTWSGGPEVCLSCYRTKVCCCYLEKIQRCSNNPQASNLYVECWEIMRHVVGTQGMLNVWLVIRQDIMRGILQNVWMCWVFWGIKWHAINWNYICVIWVWHHDGEWLWSIIESYNKSTPEHKVS